MRLPVVAAGNGWALLHGDVEAVAAALPASYFDAVLCDPPYGLSFMGKRWDYDVPSVALWSSVLRTLKPGAPILAFGGTRTYHRLVVNLEDAGAEIRDQLAWLYGSGFPKSLDAEKATGEAAWSGYGTALKPAQEPIVLARKPLDGTLAANIAAHGCGPLAIDACRIGHDLVGWGGGAAGGGSWNEENMGLGKPGDPRPVVGRWPANVILDEVAGAVLDAQSGNRPGMSGGGKHRADYPGGMFGGIDSEDTARGDQGGASRFFYCAKASRSEREAGLDHLPLVAPAENLGREEGSAGLDSPRSGAGRSSGRRNVHPTVKPQALLQYLASLIKPAGPEPRILVPFAGSGSEMVGALLAGFRDVIGIERDETYLPIAEARLRHWHP